MRQILAVAKRIVATKKFQVAVRKLGVSEVSVELDTTDEGNYWDLIFNFSTSDSNSAYFQIPYGVFWGCCGIKVVHEVRLYNHNLQRKGLGTLFMKTFMQAVAEAKMPGILLAATTDLQPEAAPWLQKLGWERSLPQFENPQTGHMITLWKWKVGPIT